MKKWIALIGLILTAGQTLEAALKRETVLYKQGKTTLEGYLAYDDAKTDRRPGVLVVHEWTGLGDYAKMRADQLAEMGYVAFAADIYGKGLRAKNHEEAGKLSGIFRSDRNLMRARAQAGLDVLKKNKRVDANKVAAIGYCFGGTSVLELARSGADIQGVVSFHGGLDTPAPLETKNVKAKILVCHGANDGFTSASVAAFQDEMRKSGTDWQMISYGGAVHSFTVKEAGSDPSTGMAYNEDADRRSWQAMKDFFAELFR